MIIRKTLLLLVLCYCTLAMSNDNISNVAYQDALALL